MGRIVTTEDQKLLVESNVRAYVAQATGPYSRLFGRGPTFVTYYSMDSAGSMSDTNLGSAVQIVGAESPLRFSEIASFPVYGISEADLSRAFDEVTGTVTGEVEGEAFVLPGTVEPFENDYFLIEHLETKVLFRVREVTPDRIEGKTFFRISYYLDEADPGTIGEQVTGEFEFEYANLGSAQSPIVAKASALALRELEVVTGALADSYWRAFYDRQAGTVLLSPGPGARGEPVFDKALEIFLARSDALGSGLYQAARVIREQPSEDRGFFEDVLFKRTIFRYALSGEAPEDSVTQSVALVRTRSSESWQRFFGMFSACEGYDAAFPVGTGTVGSLPIGGAEFLALLGSNGPPGAVAGSPIGLLLLITQASSDGDSGPRIASVARKCLRGDYRGESGQECREKIAQLASDLNSDEILSDRQLSFWLLPVILHEAKRLGSARALATLD